MEQPFQHSLPSGEFEINAQKPKGLFLEFIFSLGNGSLRQDVGNCLQRATRITRHWETRASQMSSAKARVENILENALARPCGAGTGPMCMLGGQPFSSVCGSPYSTTFKGSSTRTSVVELSFKMHALPRGFYE